MRDIMFRGKTIRDDRWVISDSISQERGKVYLYDEVKDIDVEVYPETVGQYTGVTDKNGVNIFEGDIVKREYTSLHGETEQTRETQIGVIVFDRSEFLARTTNGRVSWFYIKHVWKGDTLEIIGNKYDHGDLV